MLDVEVLPTQLTATGVKNFKNNGFISGIASDTLLELIDSQDLCDIQIRLWACKLIELIELFKELNIFARWETRFMQKNLLYA